MFRTSPLNDEEINRFEQIVHGFCDMWRVKFPQDSVTPKRHLLESHAPEQMRLFGCLGDKIESAVERLHHECNKYNRLFAAMTGWNNRQRAIYQRIMRGKVPAVVNAINAASLATKRVFSPDVTAARTATNENTAIIKRTKIDNAEMIVNLHFNALE